MTIARLVYGGDRRTREMTIAAQARPGASSVAILEGLVPGDHALASSASLTLIRIAPGCPCCTGNLTLRVTLNRVLRQPPETLFLSLADASHRESVKSFLQQEQYCGRLELGPDLDCGPAS